MTIIIPKCFLKECKYIEKKVVRQIIDDIETSSDSSEDIEIKDMKVIFLEKTILKM